MAFCIKCGTQLPDDALFCHICGQRTPVAAQAPVSAAAVTQTAPTQQYSAAVTQNPPAQGAAAAQVPPVQTPPAAPMMSAEAAYAKALENSMMFALLGLGSLVLGVLVWFLFSMWIGAILAIGAEILALMPNTLLHNAFKRYNQNPDRKARNQEEKALRKEMRAKYPGYQFSFILGVACFCVAVVFIVLI